ncbi:TIGR03364 family FAD-dependent oxidoreductase [Sphingobacterium sp. SGR-19]|uniref:TIGR03364 family FAD-dependent oxidoreductase n=1 Tax=Sphingobacterium sp. SGR-19 TaxID=2710886 RepID=UPI0013ED2718|nr:TIGR03364 family FAD-dependent oxidoreductase [Sphingobacterium sp. SGR-19]NGM64105.1 TIGR03364 family FAD-dependent oxidoreductase [Sphingobacterium sp. SGR-19]
MENHKYDLVIIGGGILGTFHAYHALLRGLRVLQLEKDNFPVGSTVRNFGQVVPSGMSDKWFEFGRRSLELYKTIQHEFDITARNNGSFYIASDKDEVQLIHELSTHYTTTGYAHQLWNKQQILTKFPDIKADYVKEAIIFEQELSVEPEIMIHRLHLYLRQKFSNYTLHYNTTVLSCDSTASGVKLNATDNQVFQAEKAIICNGYEFKLLFREQFEDSGLQISKLQMLRTVPLPQIQLPGNILTGLTIRRYESFEAYCPSFSSMHTPLHYEELQEWGIHILFKQATDGSIIIGDSHEYAKGTQFEELGYSINAHINKLILAEANRIIPINESQIAISWAGYYAQHDEHILEREIDDRIHIRTGIGGKGMTASAGYAEHSIAALYHS